MTTYDEAIADINKKLAQIDQVLEIGDVNEDVFKELTHIYTSGLILRAQFQSEQTLRERKNQYRANNVRGADNENE